MSTPPRSVAEGRTHWPTGRETGPKPPRSPWVYMIAAFAGTILAICSCLVIGTGLLAAVAAKNGGFDATPRSISYLNDTEEDLWIYECTDRCHDYHWWFSLDA